MGAQHPEPHFRVGGPAIKYDDLGDLRVMVGHITAPASPTNQPWLSTIPASAEDTSARTAHATLNDLNLHWHAANNWLQVGLQASADQSLAAAIAGCAERRRCRGGSGT